MTQPTTGLPRYALEGRVVTMDAADRVLDRGIIYVDRGRIVAVTPTGAPAPPGFEDTVAIHTRGTIFPGLIELHNHLSYNILRLWDVPRRFSNRNTWGGLPEYRKLISGPMNVLGRSTGYVEAIVRYVECKCLLGGVTTSQGIALFSNQGIMRFYRGSVRNTEAPDAPDLPAATARIADVEAADGDRFLARLRRSSCLLLHLSEGTDAPARAHFTALQRPTGDWAITPALAGIHCVALAADDYTTLQQHGGALVWSPLSNLLLYGATADIRAARDHGLRIGLGSDWSVSGSKNLLGELKVARLVSAASGELFTDRELVAMATRNAAAILKWDHALGSIEAGKHADLLVVNGRSGDPYAQLLQARETAVALVIVGGVPRYGSVRMMGLLGAGTERWQVGAAARVLNLAQEDADPIVGELTLRAAQARLRDGLARLPELARALEQPGVLGEEAEWSLVLDEQDAAGMTLRPNFDPALLTSMPNLTTAIPLSELLEPLELDRLTVADDERFLEGLAQQPNLPEYVKTGLPKLY
jgi:cytosine/adenosine deaminase-related metal-dependent hydrolase